MERLFRKSPSGPRHGEGWIAVTSNTFRCLASLLVTQGARRPEEMEKEDDVDGSSMVCGPDGGCIAEAADGGVVLGKPRACGSGK
jgi:hypothetical protein